MSRSIEPVLTTSLIDTFNFKEKTVEGSDYIITFYGEKTMLVTDENGGTPNQLTLARILNTLTATGYTIDQIVSPAHHDGFLVTFSFTASTKKDQVPVSHKPFSHSNLSLGHEIGFEEYAGAEITFFTGGLISIRPQDNDPHSLPSKTISEILSTLRLSGYNIDHILQYQDNPEIIIVYSKTTTS